MVKFYASVTATCVIQQRIAPPRPAEYDGCISILHQTADTDVSALSKRLSEYGEVLGDIDLVPSFGRGKREAHVRFATQDQAERAIAGLAGREYIPVKEVEKVAQGMQEQPRESTPTENAQEHSQMETDQMGERAAAMGNLSAKAMEEQLLKRCKWLSYLLSIIIVGIPALIVVQRLSSQRKAGRIVVGRAVTYVACWLWAVALALLVLMFQNYTRAICNIPTCDSVYGSGTNWRVCDTLGCCSSGNDGFCNGPPRCRGSSLTDPIAGCLILFQPGFSLYAAFLVPLVVVIAAAWNFTKLARRRPSTKSKPLSTLLARIRALGVRRPETQQPQAQPHDLTHGSGLPRGWYEAVASDGQKYYYHGETQETRWERPTASAPLPSPPPSPPPSAGLHALPEEATEERLKERPVDEAEEPTGQAAPFDAIAPKLDALPVYNGRSYDGKEDGRGWTIFEQGVALTTAAHLARAATQGELPERFAHAVKARPKLIDITGEVPVARDAEVNDADPAVVLKETIDAALATSWSGNKDKVREMLYEFDWLIETSIKSAAIDALAVTLDPRIQIIPSMKRRKSFIPLNDRGPMHDVAGGEAGNGGGGGQGSGMHELRQEQKTATATPSVALAIMPAGGQGGGRHELPQEQKEETATPSKTLAVDPYGEEPAESLLVALSRRLSRSAQQLFDSRSQQSVESISEQAEVGEGTHAEPHAQGTATEASGLRQHV